MPTAENVSAQLGNLANAVAALQIQLRAIGQEIITLAQVLENHHQLDSGTGFVSVNSVTYPQQAGLNITSTTGGPPGNFLVTAVVNAKASSPGDVLFAQIFNEDGPIGPLVQQASDDTGLWSATLVWEDVLRGPGVHNYKVVVTNVDSAHTVSIESGSASIILQETF